MSDLRANAEPADQPNSNSRRFGGAAHSSPSLAPRRIPIEIAFLEHYGIARAHLSRATETAERCGVGADAALLGEGLVSDEHFYRSLADRLGAPYWSGRQTIDESSDAEAAVASGFALLRPNDLGLRAVVSPRGAALRFLLEAAAAKRPLPPVTICSRQRLSLLIRARSGARIAHEAAHALEDDDRSLSASGGLSLAQIGAAAILAAFAVGLWLVAPGLIRTIVSAVLWGVFVAAIWLRWTVVVASREPPVGEPLRDDELPVYTIIAALYREERVVRDLIRALDAIDYPGIMQQAHHTNFMQR